MSLFIPKNTNFILIKLNKYTNSCAYNTCVVIHNHLNYITIYTAHVVYYKTSYTLLINYKNYFGLKFAGDYLTNYIYTWDIFFFKKIKFKGKGYKVLKTKGLMVLTFNHSHLT